MHIQHIDVNYFQNTTQEKITKRLLPIKEILNNNLRNIEHSARDLAVFIYELCASRKFEAIEITQGWIAKQLNYTRRTINTALRKLEELQLIKITRAKFWKLPHKYEFLAPDWLKKLLEKIPENTVYKSRMRNNVTQSNNLDISNIRDNININNNISRYTTTRVRASLDAKQEYFSADVELSETAEPPAIDPPKLPPHPILKTEMPQLTPAQKNAGQLAMEKIKNLLKMGTQKQKEPEKNPEDEKKPDLNTETNPINLENYAFKLQAQGEHAKAYDYFRRADEVRALAKLQQEAPIPKARPKSTYMPWGTPETAIQEKKPVKPQKTYAKAEDLPTSMRQNLRRIAFMCLGRTKEKDPAELVAQMEFSICGDLQNPDVEFGANPYAHAFHRVVKLVKEYKWERPFGYIDLQTKLAQTNEQQHFKAKAEEKEQAKTVIRIMKNKIVDF